MHSTQTMDAKVIANQTFKVKMYNNDLIKNTWDYNDLIMIGPFIILVLINVMSLSH